MKKVVVDASVNHLFDTLYHAVGLILPDAILITADERYYRKAESVGHVMLLKNINREIEARFKTRGI